MSEPTEPAPFDAEARFAVVPEWIVFHPDLSGNDVRLYAVLARFVDGQHKCFPGRALLAQKAHMSERQVFTCVENLERASALTCHRRWKDEQGRIFYSSGKGRTQTSSEYILRVLGVAAKSAATWRQNLPTNERTTKNVRRQNLPPLPTSTDSVPLGLDDTPESMDYYRKLAAQRRAEMDPAERDAQDRMAHQGKYKSAEMPS